MILRAWHNWLNMERHDKAWHLDDLKDEMEEYDEARGLIERWSELCDVVYTCTRSHWDGYPDIKYPYAWWTFAVGLIYMFPKYTLRWLFFRKVAKRFGKKISAIRNPKKTHKLRDIAEEFGMDPDAFEKECKRVMKYWVFLK